MASMSDDNDDNNGIRISQTIQSLKIIIGILLIPHMQQKQRNKEAII